MDLVRILLEQQARRLDGRAVVDALDRAELGLDLLDGDRHGLRVRDVEPQRMDARQAARRLGEPGLVHVGGGDDAARGGPAARGGAPDAARRAGHEDQLPRCLHLPPPESVSGAH